MADIRKKSRDSGFALGANGAQRKHVARRALLYPTLSLRACTKREADIKKVTRQRVCVEHKRSATEARRKTCITISHHYLCVLARKEWRIYEKSHATAGLRWAQTVRNGSTSQDVHYHSPPLSSACLHEKSDGYKKKVTQQRFALSANGAQRKHIARRALLHLTYTTATHVTI